MKRCSKCGNEIPDQMSFCSQCGAKYENAPNGAVCRACNTVNPIGSMYCQNCGGALKDNTAQPVPGNTAGSTSGSLTFVDFIPLACGVLSLIAFAYDIGLILGIISVIAGFIQMKSAKSKPLCIAGLAAGALGVLVWFATL